MKVMAGNYCWLNAPLAIVLYEKKLLDKIIEVYPDTDSDNIFNTTRKDLVKLREKPEWNGVVYKKAIN